MTAADRFTLSVYDLRGKLVYAHEVGGSIGKRFFWNGMDSQRRPVESGIYLYRIATHAEEESQVLSTGKLLALK
jgi:flagellar hook assembly protein FlgD